MRMIKDIQEFVANCDIGHEFEFDYKGIGYGIGWDKSGKIVAYRKKAFGLHEQTFDTAEEMLNHFIIDGEPLHDVLPKAVNVIMY
jgi:hypothetical protein